MMNRILGGRSAAASNLNKPLPEPLVDPDLGKVPIGELIIIPIQGRDLPNRERFGKQDPFILFKLGNVSKRSSTDVRGGQRPRWLDDQININFYESDAKDAKSLFVTCLDEDPQKNDLIGDCVINLSKVLEKGEHDDWFQLSYKSREAGELLLQLSYFSFDPQSSLHKSKRVASPTPPGAHPRRVVKGLAPPKAAVVKAEETADSADEDDANVYKPPVVPEAPTYQDPAIHQQQQQHQAQQPLGATGYPTFANPPAPVNNYGGYQNVPGRPVSPGFNNNYPNNGGVPPVSPGHSPYGGGAVGGAPNVGGVYPPVNNQFGGPGPNPVNNNNNPYGQQQGGGYPTAQTGGFNNAPAAYPNNNSFTNLNQPQPHIPSAYPPSNNAPYNGNTAQPQPQVVGGMGGIGGGAYPPNNNNNGGFPNQQFPAAGGAYPYGNNNNNNGGAYPPNNNNGGAYPPNNNNGGAYPPNNINNNIPGTPFQQNQQFPNQAYPPQSNHSINSQSSPPMSYGGSPNPSYGSVNSNTYGGPSSPASSLNTIVNTPVFSNSNPGAYPMAAKVIQPIPKPAASPVSSHKAAMYNPNEF